MPNNEETPIHATYTTQGINAYLANTAEWVYQPWGPAPTTEATPVPEPVGGQQEEPVNHAGTPTPVEDLPEMPLPPEDGWVPPPFITWSDAPRSAKKQIDKEDPVRISNQQRLTNMGFDMEKVHSWDVAPSDLVKNLLRVHHSDGSTSFVVGNTVPIRIPAMMRGYIPSECAGFILSAHGLSRDVVCGLVSLAGGGVASVSDSKKAPMVALRSIGGRSMRFPLTDKRVFALVFLGSYILEPKQVNLTCSIAHWVAGFNRGHGDMGHADHCSMCATYNNSVPDKMCGDEYMDQSHLMSHIQDESWPIETGEYAMRVMGLDASAWNKGISNKDIQARVVRTIFDATIARLVNGLYNKNGG